MGGVEATSDPFLGRVLDGRYAIEARLGEGGLGVVYRAKQTRLGRPVAVKVLHAEHAQKKALRERFDREARSLGTLVHPNIVQVIDYGIEDDAPFLVMELLEGRPLNDAIREGIALDRAWDIGRTIVAAVAYAHGRRIVHRDLKPANVFLQRDPEGKELTRVLDFGLAKFVDDESDETVLTKAGSILGTPAYMSPEQASGAPSDERSDVYSLGIVLFELLTGQRPFQGPPVELLRMHLVAELPTLSSVRPGIPNAELIDLVLRRATAKAVCDRYPDAGELLAALDSIGRPTGELVSGVAERPKDVSLDATVLGKSGATPLGAAAKSQPSGAGAPGPFGLGTHASGAGAPGPFGVSTHASGAGGAAPFGMSMHGSRGDGGPPDAAARRRMQLMIAAGALVVLAIAGAAAAFSGDDAETAEGPGAGAADETLAAAAPSEARPFGRCEGDHPASVVLARLAPGEPIRSAEELQSALDGIPLDSVVVHRLSGASGQVAERAVTFELSRSSWPEWSRVEQGSGEEICRSVGNAILAKVDRAPGPLDFYARREPSVRAEPVGTLDSDTDELDASILDWIQPLETSTQCKYQPGYGGDGTLVVSCDVNNPRRSAARFEITAVVYVNGEPQPVYREELDLEPGQRIARQYDVRGGSPESIGSCACEVKTSP